MKKLCKHGPHSARECGTESSKGRCFQKTAGTNVLRNVGTDMEEAVQKCFSKYTVCVSIQ